MEVCVHMYEVIDGFEIPFFYFLLNILSSYSDLVDIVLKDNVH